MADTHSAAIERARLALDGLTLGNQFGEHFFMRTQPIEQLATALANRELPQDKWAFTDDTNMALSIVAGLNKFQKIDQDWLAHSFAKHFDPYRGYGAGAVQLLVQLRRGADWRKVSKTLFFNEGSFGNGAAMRVAPLGAYFADDLAKVVEQARLSSEITHAHPEGIAGGIAVAVAAALAWQLRGQEVVPAQFIEQVVQLTPDSEVRETLKVAAKKPYDPEVENIVRVLGNGSKVIAQDTVAFAVWCAAHHLKDFEEAMWYTVSGLGDRDTTCAIVGGIVACHVGRDGLPQEWLNRREALPGWILE